MELLEEPMNMNSVLEEPEIPFSERTSGLRGSNSEGLLAVGKDQMALIVQKTGYDINIYRLYNCLSNIFFIFSSTMLCNRVHKTSIFLNL